MINPFKQIFKQFNSYTRSDRNAMLILSILILLVLISNVLIKRIDSNSSTDSAEFHKILSEMEEAFVVKKEQELSLFYFDPNKITKKELDSLALPGFVKLNILNYRKAGGKFYRKTDLKSIYGMNDSIYKLVESFVVIRKNISVRDETVQPKVINSYSGTLDINKADKTELRKLGLNDFQSRNIIRYRNAGGVFKHKTDLLRIYGLDSLSYNSVEKYIIIDSLILTQKNAFDTRALLELNQADSTELVKLKGIGPVYASRSIE